MRVFERSDGGTVRFRSIDGDGKTLTVREGVVGADGDEPQGEPEVIQFGHPRVVPGQVDRRVTAWVDEGWRERGLVAEAPTDRVPAALVRPPWTAARDQIVCTGLQHGEATAIAWEPGEREAWTPDRNSWKRSKPLAELLAGYDSLRDPDRAWLFIDGDRDVVAPLLAGWAPRNVHHGLMQAVVARHELDALPALLAGLKAYDNGGAGDALLPFVSPEIVDRCAMMLGKKTNTDAYRNALAWFTRHPGYAARVLVPQAVGRTVTHRRRAERALAAIATVGDRHRAAVLEAADAYGPQPGAAVRAVVDAHRFEVPDRKLPKLPGWVHPASLPQVLLRDGSGALSAEAVTVLCTMLAMTTEHGEYAALADVVAACDRSTLDELLITLIGRWVRHGGTKDHEWVLHAFVPVAGDTAVRRLAPQISDWSSSAGVGYGRAGTGAAVLARIGTQTALLALQRMAVDHRHKGLARIASWHIHETARMRGIIERELIDQLVPDFGLDADGSLVLNYGPRRFTVGFDEQLEPFVRDGKGTRRAALPKPGAKDDPVLAPDAYSRFAELRRDVRKITGEQVRRFERMMVWQEARSAADFGTYIVGHPLLRHLARRLVWAARHDDTTVLFRVAEDLTFADVDDKPLTVHPDAVVTLPHPVHLGPDVARWREVLDDYELAQPFEQLHRRPAGWGDADPVPALERVRGDTTTTGHLLGLERRGWRLDSMTSGVRDVLYFDLPAQRTAVLVVEPGIPRYFDDAAQVQTVTSLYVHHRDPEAPKDFTSLGAVGAFELLRELEAILR